MSLFTNGDLHPCPNPKERQKLEQQRARAGKKAATKLLEAAEALQEYMSVCTQLYVIMILLAIVIWMLDDLAREPLTMII